MIETFKDMKHGKSSSYEDRSLERTAHQILHRMEDKVSEDSLESTRARVLGRYSFTQSALNIASKERMSEKWLTITS
jgi:GTP cyclohydrolase I